MPAILLNDKNYLPCPGRRILCKISFSWIDASGMTPKPKPKKKKKKKRRSKKKKSFTVPWPRFIVLHFSTFLGNVTFSNFPPSHIAIYRSDTPLNLLHSCLSRSRHLSAVSRVLWFVRQGGRHTPKHV